MQTATLSSPTTLTHIDGATHVTAAAVRGAIAVAFGTQGDPPIRSVQVKRQGIGWRAVVAFEQAEATPLERRKWVTEEFLPRWTTLEHQLNARLYLRREWV